MFEDSDIVLTDIDLDEFTLSLKKYIAISSIILLISSIVGYYIGSKLVSAGSLGVVDSSFRLFLSILANNLIAMALVILVGFLFGILPIIILILNGLSIGSAAWVISSQKGFETLFLGIFPHGIIEIPLIIFASAIGLEIGHNFLKRSTWFDEQVRSDADKAIEIYVWIILPLTVVAALIETYLTTLLI